MHRMQSGGWPYSKVGRDSSKAPSLRAAVLRAASCLSFEILMHEAAAVYVQ